MDNQFWDSIRSDLHKTARINQDHRMRQYPVPYSHPYARQVQWNYHTNNVNNGQGVPSTLMNMTSSEQDMAGGVAVHVDDLKQTFETLAEDVETLRRVLTQQQQILEALRHQQGVVSGDTARHETAIMELTSARPARDAWVAQADASIRSSAQQCSSLHNRVEQLAISCHERPSREELGVAITSAIIPLSNKVEVLDSSVQKMGALSYPSTDHTATIDEKVSKVFDERLKGAVLEVLGSMNLDSNGSGGGSAFVGIELEEAKLALNTAKQQLVAQTQHSERLIAQNNSSLSPQSISSNSDHAALEAYWSRIQGFVSSKLGEFEARMTHRTSHGTSAVSEDRVQAIEKSVKEANETMLGLVTQLDHVKNSQTGLASTLRDLRDGMSQEVRAAIQASQTLQTQEMTTFVGSAVTKESSRWERKLDEALEATVSRCRSACNADAKYNIDKALATAETTAGHLVEASRSSADTIFSDAERRLRASVEESRESISRCVRKASELEDRVDQVERSVRGDLRKLRDEVRDSSESDTVTRRFAQTQPQPFYQPQLTQANLQAAVSSLLSAVPPPQNQMQTPMTYAPAQQGGSPSMSSFASPNKEQGGWREEQHGNMYYQQRVDANRSNTNSGMTTPQHTNYNTPQTNAAVAQNIPFPNLSRGDNIRASQPLTIDQIRHIGDSGITATSNGGAVNAAATAGSGSGSDPRLENNEMKANSSSGLNAPSSVESSLGKLGPLKSIKPVSIPQFDPKSPPPTLASSPPARSPSPEVERERSSSILSAVSNPDSEASNVSHTSVSSAPTRRRRRSFSIANVDVDLSSSAVSTPNSPVSVPIDIRGRGRSEPPQYIPAAETLASLEVDDEEEGEEEDSKSKAFDKASRTRSPINSSRAVDLEESGDSFEGSTDSVSKHRRRSHKRLPSKSPPRRPAALPEVKSLLPGQRSSPLNFGSPNTLESFDVNEAAGPDGPPPPLMESRPSTLMQSSPRHLSKESTKEDSPSDTGSVSSGTATFQSTSTSSSSASQSLLSPSSKITSPVSKPTSAPVDPNRMTAEKAASIRTTPVPSTCAFDPEDPIDMQLRSEGWSKHSGKNGNHFWAVIGDGKLSMWTRPAPGDLAIKRKQNAAVTAAAEACLEVGALTQAEIDSVWALILNKTRTAEAVVKEWRAKEAAFRKQAETKPKMAPVAEFRPRENNMLHGVGDRQARESLALSCDSGDGDSPSGSSTSSASTFSSSMSSSNTSSFPTQAASPTVVAAPNGPLTPSGARPSVFKSAFAKKSGAASVSEFATKALGWNKEELGAHLRSKGLTPIAAMFENEVIDSKTLALMETEDLTSPKPEGFGLSEEDPMFQALWALKKQLKAALDREQMKEKFQNRPMS